MRAVFCKLSAVALMVVSGEVAVVTESAEAVVVRGAATAAAAPRAKTRNEGSCIWLDAYELAKVYSVLSWYR